MKKDFLKVVVAYLAAVILIMVIIPINTKWALVAWVLVAFAFVLQLYCNSYNKSIPKDIPKARTREDSDVNINTIMQVAGLEMSMYKSSVTIQTEHYKKDLVEYIEYWKRELSHGMFKQLPKDKQDSFVITPINDFGMSRMELELVILTKEELKRLINVCINL